MSPSPVYLTSAEANISGGKNCHIHLTFSQIMSLRFAVIRYNYTTRENGYFGDKCILFQSKQFSVFPHFHTLWH